MVYSALAKLYSRHQGKLSDKWSIYISAYERLFSELKDRLARILEIGIQNGGSLGIWSEYFPQASKIVGCDINEARRQLTYSDPRITVIVGDINSDVTEQANAAQSQEFELIIEDGSHRSGDIIRSFRLRRTVGFTARAGNEHQRVCLLVHAQGLVHQ